MHCCRRDSVVRVVRGDEEGCREFKGGYEEEDLCRQP